MDIIFIIITVLWLLEFLLFPSLYKSKKNSRSFSVILVCIITVMLTNGLMYLTDTLLFKSYSLKGISLLIYTLGLTIRYYSLVLLGENFSREVDVKKDQELVSRGLYRYIRHPLYLGLFLLTVAVPLYFGNVLMFILASLLMLWAISIRIDEEEEMMQQVLGERYKVWKDKRYKFIPFIY